MDNNDYIIQLIQSNLAAMLMIEQLLKETTTSPLFTEQPTHYKGTPIDELLEKLEAARNIKPIPPRENHIFIAWLEVLAANDAPVGSIGWLAFRLAERFSDNTAPEEEGYMERAVPRMLICEALEPLLNIDSSAGKLAKSLWNELMKHQAEDEAAMGL